MHWATRQLASIPIFDPFIPPALICSFSCCRCSSIFSIYALDLDRHLAVIFSLVDRVDMLLEPTQAIYAVVKKIRPKQTRTRLISAVSAQIFDALWIQLILPLGPMIPQQQHLLRLLTMLNPVFHWLLLLLPLFLGHWVILTVLSQLCKRPLLSVLQSDTLSIRDTSKEYHFFMSFEGEYIG